MNYSEPFSLKALQDALASEEYYSVSVQGSTTPKKTFTRYEYARMPATLSNGEKKAIVIEAVRIAHAETPMSNKKFESVRINNIPAKRKVVHVPLLKS